MPEVCSPQYGDDQKYEDTREIPDHTAAMHLVIEALLDKRHGVLSSINEIGAVGHRVLHGGEKFSASILIDKAVEDAIEEYIPLGPLHNPANLMGIRACQAVIPKTPQVAVFDTAFHQTMPPKAYMYGMPYEYYEKHHIRRYGFHGTSHRFVSGRAVELWGKPHSRIIVCHLGNGSSMSAVVDGKCFDTSMGLTPLEGVLMGTRSGSLDPAVVEYMAMRENLSVTEVLTILNKKSGLIGISGASQRHARCQQGGRRGQRARKAGAGDVGVRRQAIHRLLCRRHGRAGYAGVHRGIGENDDRVAEKICEGLEFLGVKLDKEVNLSVRSREARISAADSKVEVWVIPTNEELASPAIRAIS